MKKLFAAIVQKRSLRIVSAVILALMLGAAYLTVVSAREMKRTINEHFNAQQLEMARHAAGILSENFRILKRELTTLSLSPSIQYLEAVSWANRMKISFSTVRGYGVTRINFIRADGRKAFSTDYTYMAFEEEGDFADQDYFRWCRQAENKTRVFISHVMAGIVEDSERGFIEILATPVYQVSEDEAHPEATHQFAGVLTFTLDTGLFARKVVGPLRSGKTGYAWVIDEAGNFLYHLQRDFVGQNAFEIRKFKDPHISFSKIDLIQKEKMLQGEEGTSWYMSGWHRGETGSIRKLIAYTPVEIGAANTRRIWSVAVVAPVSEVEDEIQSVYLRHSLMEGAFILAATIVLALFIGIERVWLRILEDKVREKTVDLEAYAGELRRSEARFRSLIESADDMIYTLDRNCNMVSVNQYYTRFTGQQPAAVIGRRVTDLIEYRPPAKVPQIVQRVLATAQTIDQEEQVKIGGKEYWLDTKYKPIPSAGSQSEAVLVISRDITEHKNIETQLFHAEKLASLGSLSAGVAHEINNPIAIILGFTEVLSERFPEESKEKEILKAIERQGNNCKRIVENLLAFARLPQKTATESDVLQDLQRVIHVVANTLLTRKIELRTDIAEDLPRVRGDGPQLEQVFLNIINNAVAAMENGGMLTVAVSHSGGTVRVAFKDTGQGIPPEIRDKIFEPFFTTKKVGEGTGLGLSVSYGIVKKFGGDIRVESQTEEPGTEPGTTFTVLLPVADDTTAGVADTQGQAQGSE